MTYLGVLRAWQSSQQTQICMWRPVMWACMCAPDHNSHVLSHSVSVAGTVCRRGPEVCPSHINIHADLKASSHTHLLMCVLKRHTVWSYPSLIDRSPDFTDGLMLAELVILLCLLRLSTPSQAPGTWLSSESPWAVRDSSSTCQSCPSLAPDRTLPLCSPVCGGVEPPRFKAGRRSLWVQILRPTLLSMGQPSPALPKNSSETPP